MTTTIACPLCRWWFVLNSDGSPRLRPEPWPPHLGRDDSEPSRRAPIRGVRVRSARLGGRRGPGHEGQADAAERAGTSPELTTKRSVAILTTSSGIARSPSGDTTRQFEWSTETSIHCAENTSGEF